MLPFGPAKPPGKLSAVWADGPAVGMVALVRLYIQGVGMLKVKLHRPVGGTIKTVTLTAAIADGRKPTGYSHGYMTVVRMRPAGA